MSEKSLPSSEKRYFLTAIEVAKLFSVSSKTVIRWIDSGALPGYRLPGKRRTRRVLIKTLVEFCKANPEHNVILERYVRQHFAERRAIAARNQGETP